MNFIKKLLATQNSWALTIVRITIGGVMLPHGLQKTLGMFGGRGWSATVEGMSNSFPAPLVMLAILAESLGAQLLIFGAGSRVMAFGIFATMVVAAMQHQDNGFFMNWFGNQAGEGYEYHLLALGLSLAVMIGGGGALSVDRAISPRD